jgi:hypothetical protein
MEPSLRQPFAEAVHVATDLVLRPEVAARWTDESACAGMSVGALARHLVSQWFNVVRLLRAPAGEAPITVWQHYERAAWVHTSLDDDVNIAIREGSEESAAEGPGAMRTLVASLAPDLADVLATERDGSVLIPWQGWSLTEHGFLATRLMEVAVHSDDLAASVDLATPEFPDSVLAAPVLDLLTGLAVRRHGATAVLRALTRPQRAPDSISAF